MPQGLKIPNLCFAVAMPPKGAPRETLGRLDEVNKPYSHSQEREEWERGGGAKLVHPPRKRERCYKNAGLRAQGSKSELGLSDFW